MLGLQVTERPGVAWGDMKQIKCITMVNCFLNCVQFQLYIANIEF